MKINTTIPNEIGLPLSSIISKLDPSADIARKKTAELQYNSLPMCIIYPCQMRLGDGIKNFYLEPVWGDKSSTQTDLNTYLGLLKSHGVEIIENHRGLKVLYYPETSITENFSNNYGDTFIGSYLKSFGAEGLTDLNQMLGGQGDFRTGLENLLNDLGPAGSMMGGALEYGTNHLQNQSSPLIRNIGNTVSKALGGQRFDFPSVWKSSGFNANYSLNIKLFNPNPNDEATTAKYIAGPLCALLCLGLPIGHGDSYSWPFIHIIESPGFFASRAVAVQNISVTKGGDQNLHSAFTGLVDMIDVRIDFVNLYEPMIAGDTKDLLYRTNLDDYLSNITNSKILGFNEQALSKTIANLNPTAPPQSTATGGSGNNPRTNSSTTTAANNTQPPKI